MKIIIEFIPHSLQRYETVGDYFYDENGDLNIKVSDLGDEYMNRLVVLHELIEEAITKKRGITETEIMKFDLLFEEEAKYGKHPEIEEPGRDKRAPYRNEHIFAEIMERLFAQEMEIDWTDYDKEVMSL
jgi:hypothetical protein